MPYKSNAVNMVTHVVDYDDYDVNKKISTKFNCLAGWHMCIWHMKLENVLHSCTESNVVFSFHRFYSFPISFDWYIDIT